MKDKKGQLAGLGLVIITLVIAAFTLVLGLQLLAGFQTVSDDYDATVTNETGCYLNTTGYTLGKVGVRGFNSPRIITAVNNTNASVLASSAYVLSGNVVYNGTSAFIKDCNITYAYKYGQDAYAASNKSIEGNASFADFWSLIVLAVVISIVIGLILYAFSSKKVR